MSVKYCGDIPQLANETKYDKNVLQTDLVKSQGREIGSMYAATPVMF